MSGTRFVLDPRLAESSLPLAELRLCALRLVKDARWPWLLLVPRRDGCSEPFDLDQPAQLQLWQEAMLCAGALKTVTGAAKTNVAVIGNKVAQLHLHVIARKPDDPEWPEPVWGRGEALPRDGLPDWVPALRARLAQEPQHD